MKQHIWMTCTSGHPYVFVTSLMLPVWQLNLSKEEAIIKQSARHPHDENVWHPMHHILSKMESVLN